jgi:tRNA(Ile)-lysidine synthase
MQMTIETFLINLSRGTGLEGLVGIPAQNDKLYALYCFFSRRKANYANENDIKWREDSNASDKYCAIRFVMI